jgi:aldehyde dehydrogenase (NAD+)
MSNPLPPSQSLFSTPWSATGASMESVNWGRWGHIAGDFSGKDGTGRSLSLLSPWDGAPMFEVRASNADPAAFIERARDASSRWQALAGATRACHLLDVARLLDDERAELSRLESASTGVPVRVTGANSVAVGVDAWRWNAGWADKVKWAFDGRPVQPAGTVLISTGCDAPVAVTLCTAAGALAAGNAVILEPDFRCPFAAVQLQQACRAAGLPDALVSIWLADQPFVRPASTALPDRWLRIGLPRLGTASPALPFGCLHELTAAATAFVVDENAALREAAASIVHAALTRRGLVPHGGNRVLVQESVEASFVRLLQEQMRLLHVGHPLDRLSDVGTMMTSEDAAAAEHLVLDSQRRGALVWRPEVAGRSGSVVAPALVWGVESASPILHTSCGGPLLPVQTWRTLDEAIDMANSHDRTGAAAVFSESWRTVTALSQALTMDVFCNVAPSFDGSRSRGGGRSCGGLRLGGRAGLQPMVATEVP